MPSRSASLPLACSIDDPAVQRGLELLGDGFAAAHVAFVQQADGGHVGQRLADAQVRRVEAARCGAEQVQRADDLIPQPHRQRLHRREPGPGGGLGEPGPPRGRAGQVGSGDGPAGTEALQAGPFVVLQLEQLQQPGFLAGGRRDPQLAARVGQHDPGRGRGQQGDAAVGEHVQEVDDVEVGDHRVGQLDEGVGKQVGVHLGHLSSLAGQTRRSAAGGSVADAAGCVMGRHLDPGRG